MAHAITWFQIPAADMARAKKFYETVCGFELLPLPDELPQDEPEQAVVDQLTACLPRVLTELDSADRDILTRCDIEGMTQQAYANQQGLSLPAVKSRLLRARTRLKNQLHTACAVRLDDQGLVCCYTPRAPLPEQK